MMDEIRKGKRKKKEKSTSGFRRIIVEDYGKFSQDIARIKLKKIAPRVLHADQQIKVGNCFVGTVYL